MPIFPLAGVLRGFFVIDVLNVSLDENPCVALASKKIPYL
jgi:hypothetical protein